MKLKKICVSFFHPHVAVLLILTPFAIFFLVGAMVFIGEKSWIAIASYVLSAYTLSAWCIRMPQVINTLKSFKNENKYLHLWRNNPRLRVKVSLYASLTGNTVYGAFQLWLGFYHKTFWYASLGVYYLCLALMRFFLLGHAKKYEPGERMRAELKRYIGCGIVFLFMNLVLSVIVFFIIYYQRNFEHHMITAIAMAAYTFAAFVIAIIKAIKYRKYNSPVFIAAKMISFASACVSMLTLTSTMLTTFSDGTVGLLGQSVMIGVVGFAVSMAFSAMAIYMIVRGSKQIKSLEIEVENGK